ncbi:repressor phrH2 [Halarchaeum sp. P4]|uniref:repressor phrH2 n=1 Tax=Halarchaeum sp. P4 TaxID=3421639 RepID=UPI003EBF302A
MSVRIHARWVTSADEDILEYLRDRDLASPSEITRAIRTPATTRRVRERLRVLSQAEYVAPLDDDYDVYQLTIWGRLYLDGEVRADLLIPEPDPRRPGHVLG